MKKITGLLSVLVSCYTKGVESGSYLQDVRHHLRGGNIMKDLEKFIHESEMNAIPDNQINLSDIPEITDFSRGTFQKLEAREKARHCEN